MMSFKNPLRVVFFVILAISSSSIQAEVSRYQVYENHSISIYPELLEIRRDLFNHPERSGQEKRTSAVVARYLSELGLDVKTNIGGYGVVGILKGAKPGKKIVWRADMDAASFQFGAHDHGDHKLGHVCGHDVHTTIGLGIANTLSQDTENLPGTVYFLFQPAEESQKGAKAMINDGLFDIIEADEIYAAHVGPSQTGVISTRAGNLFSHSRYLQIEFSGSQDKQALIDAVHAMMGPLTKLRSPEKFVNLNTAMDLEIGIAHPDTIYQDYILFAGPPVAKASDNKITLHAELYTAEHKDIAMIAEQLKQRIKTSNFKDRFTSMRVLHEREGVDNDAELTDIANQILVDSFGKRALEKYYGQVPFASEDFGHFQKKVPGVYFFIGASNAHKGIVAFPHMPDFTVDEAVIHHGVTRFSTLIRQRL